MTLFRAESHEPLVAGAPLFVQMARRMGVPQLYDFQEEAVRLSLRGRDSFLVVPTGSGKSFCYLIPALVQNGLVLVVSPLISLMRDQRRQLEALDIPSLSLDSLMSSEERRNAHEQIVQHKLKVLYVSPERLALPGFRDLLRDVPLALIAIDEAHCVHQWGMGFRPEYRRLGAYLDDLGPAPRMALTATLTRRERSEIIQSLRLRDPELILRTNPRHNLELTIERHGKVEDQKQKLLESVYEQSGMGIVYCSTRKSAEEIYQDLQRKGISAGLYHGGMLATQRQDQQSAFTEGRYRVMVATKAFGMGIHLPNIRFVWHASLPCSIESYTQEIGRAGRDGRKASCFLHYGPRDYYIQKFMIDKSYPSETELMKVHEALSSLFEKRGAYREEALVQKLVAVTDLEIDTVATTLEFLYREQTCVVSDFPDDDGLRWDSYVMPSEDNRSLDNLLQALREQVAWRYDKLKAMHRLVKQGSCPREFIEQYFA
jgi:ATP-dependent DNA helicase RecQ